MADDDTLENITQLMLARIHNANGEIRRVLLKGQANFSPGVSTMAINSVYRRRLHGKQELTAGAHNQRQMLEGLVSRQEAWHKLIARNPSYFAGDQPGTFFSSAGYSELRKVVSTLQFTSENIHVSMAEKHAVLEELFNLSLRAFLSKKGKIDDCGRRVNFNEDQSITTAVNYINERLHHPLSRADLQNAGVALYYAGMRDNHGIMVNQLGVSSEPNSSAAASSSLKEPHRSATSVQGPLFEVEFNAPNVSESTVSTGTHSTVTGISETSTNNN